MAVYHGLPIISRPTTVRFLATQGATLGQNFAQGMACSNATASVHLPGICGFSPVFSGSFKYGFMVINGDEW